MEFKAPEPEDFYGMDPAPDLPAASVKPEVGWLAPDGLYFPCDIFSEYGGGNGHETKAREIIYHLYPDLCNSREWNVGDAQMELLGLGWVRTDYNKDWLMPKRLTPEQMVTLNKLIRMPQCAFNQRGALTILLVENYRWREARRKGEE